jgi:histidinol dehydrogenase
MREPEKSDAASGDFTAVTNRIQPTKRYFKARCHLNVTHMRAKNMYINVYWKT